MLDPIEISKNTNINTNRRPEWLKVRAAGFGENFSRIKNILKEESLHTVCEEAHCPNQGHCWQLGTATFMILGDICVRNCKFCAVGKGKPLPPDITEPDRVAESINKMKLRHAVITSVTRDDLQDYGAGIWAETIRKTKLINPKTTVEVLIPDFMGKEEFIQLVLDAKPDVLNHNIETIPRLYPRVRRNSNYQISLSVLDYSKKQGFITKTGIMVGLGETHEEVLEVMRDLRNIDVNILTIGQYLQPTKEHLLVEKYVTPEEFEKWRTLGLEMGFSYVASAPLVRSSYHAEEQFQ